MPTVSGGWENLSRRWKSLTKSKENLTKHPRMTLISWPHWCAIQTSQFHSCPTKRGDVFGPTLTTHVSNCRSNRRVEGTLLSLLLPLHLTDLELVSQNGEMLWKHELFWKKCFLIFMPIQNRATPKIWRNSFLTMTELFLWFDLIEYTKSFLLLCLLRLPPLSWT